MDNFKKFTKNITFLNYLEQYPDFIGHFFDKNACL